MNESLTTASPPASSRSSLRQEVYRARLPFFLWLLVGYLATDAGIRILSVAIEFLSREEFTWNVTREQFWDLLLGAFYLVLALQILVRSFAARISISVILTLQIVLFIANYAVLSPELWWGTNTATRLQLLAQLLFFTISLILLNRRPVKDVLRL